MITSEPPSPVETDSAYSTPRAGKRKDLNSTPDSSTYNVDIHPEDWETAISDRCKRYLGRYKKRFEANTYDVESWVKLLALPGDKECRVYAYRKGKGEDSLNVEEFDVLPCYDWRIFAQLKSWCKKTYGVQRLPLATFGKRNSKGQDTFKFFSLTFLELYTMMKLLAHSRLGICTIVMEDKYAHLYFDFDLDDKTRKLDKDKDHLQRVQMLSEIEEAGGRRAVVNEWNELFPAFFQQEFDREMDLSVVQWEDGSVIDENGKYSKLSLHLHVVSESFVNNANMKEFIVAFCRAHSDSWIGRTMDLTVYDKWRNFKIVGSRKAGRQPLAVYHPVTDTTLPLDDITHEHLFNSLISYSHCGQHEWLEYKSDAPAKKKKRVQPTKPEAKVEGSFQDHTFEEIEHGLLLYNAKPLGPPDEDGYIQCKNIGDDRPCPMIKGEVHNRNTVKCRVLETGVFIGCHGQDCTSLGWKLLLPPKKPAVVGMVGEPAVVEMDVSIEEQFPLEEHPLVVEVECIPELSAMVMSLSTQRVKHVGKAKKVVWVIQRCGGTKEMAIEWYKRSDNPDHVSAVNEYWDEGFSLTERQKVGIGSLHHWLKEDLGEEEYVKRRSEWQVLNKAHRTAEAKKAQMMAKSAVINEIAGLLDKDKVKNWNNTIRDLIAAGVCEDRIHQLFEGTDGAPLVESCWKSYNQQIELGLLKRSMSPLWSLLKKQGMMTCDIDLYKKKLQAAGKVESPRSQEETVSDEALKGYHEELKAIIEEPDQSTTHVLGRIVKWVDDHKLPSTYLNIVMPYLNCLIKYIEQGDNVLIRVPDGDTHYTWVAHLSTKFEKRLFPNKKVGNKSIAEAWWSHRHRQQYSRVSRLPPLLSEKLDRHSFNHWSPFYAEKLPKVDMNNLSDDLKKALKETLDLIWDMTGGEKGDPENKEEPKLDKAGFKWYTRHCSYVLKYPGKKTNCYVVFYSPKQGQGKSSTGKLMRALIGPQHSLFVPKDLEGVIFGTYNAHMEGICFIDLDDGGDSEVLRKHWNEFNGMITAPTQIIRDMRVSHVPDVPAFEMWQSSCNRIPVYEAGGRRNQIFRSGAKYLGNKDFWDKFNLVWLKDPEYLSMMYQWFTAIEVSEDENFQLTKPTHLSSMLAMDALSAPIEMDWLIADFFEGKEEVPRSVEFQATALTARYNAFREPKGLKIVSAKLLGARLIDLEVDGITKKVKTAGTFYTIEFTKLRAWLTEKRYMEAVTEDVPAKVVDKEDNIR